MKVDRVAWAPYTLATKSTVSATNLNVSATKSTATSCRIHVVADLLPKPATKLNASATKWTVPATVDFVADLLPVSATVNFNEVDRVDFNFVASVYRALKCKSRGDRGTSEHGVNYLVPL